MKIMIFKLINRIYFGDVLFGDNTSILSCFLTDDVGPGLESFIEFIKNPKIKRTTRNYCCLKKDGKDVLIGCQFDADPYANSIRMTQREFLSMLNQWDRLTGQRPEKIIVFKEGDTYRLEGHGFPGKE